MLIGNYSPKISAPQSTPKPSFPNGLRLAARLRDTSQPRGGLAISQQFNPLGLGNLNNTAIVFFRSADTDATVEKRRILERTSIPSNGARVNISSSVGHPSDHEADE